MAYKNLAEFIRLLEKENELVRIQEFVSPNLEITEINDRIVKHNGKALLFENNGTNFPVLINAFGSEKRIQLALGVNSLENIGEEIDKWFQILTEPKTAFSDKLKLLPQLYNASQWMPKHKKGRGSCQEVVIQNPDLSKLPILTTWPHDGGPFITLPVVHTSDPKTGTRNVGMYRMQVFDNQTTGMHWHLHKNSARHYREYKALGKRMPISVALGGDPVYTYVATAPLPDHVDEYILAGFLRKRPVELVKCITNNLEVPADAEFILEGYVDPAEDLRIEGPFGDHTGFYSLADYYPVFHVECITHRKNAIYPTTVVGIPPQEDAWLGKATERIFLTPIKKAMLPEVTDMDLPIEGVFHNIAIISIDKTYPGQAPKVMNSLWGAGQMMFTKFFILVDKDVNVHNYTEVLNAIQQNCNLNADIYFSKGPADVLDHSSQKYAIHGKMGMDATRKLTGEFYDSDFGNLQNGNKQYFNLEEIQNVKKDFRLNDFLHILTLQKTDNHTVHSVSEALLKQIPEKSSKVVLFTDPEVEANQIADVCWIAGNNLDPERDCKIFTNTERKTTLLIMDACRKKASNDHFFRDWPNVLVMSEDVIERIDSIWPKLNLGDFIQSPSLRYKRLLFPGKEKAE